eukprot:TRINITY_DN4179_c0_g1_i18.p1 TRINITY_DN4179_c0_g1~~TRINITY_DN4179_c0_g1_i18.p1  ORF type:complete len:539 (-),score=111.42 TRINITY_DN4179_c0_g1_i18:472-2088(-)
MKMLLKDPNKIPQINIDGEISNDDESDGNEDWDRLVQGSDLNLYFSSDSDESSTNFGVDFLDGADFSGDDSNYYFSDDESAHFRLRSFLSQSDDGGEIVQEHVNQDYTSDENNDLVPGDDADDLHGEGRDDNGNNPVRKDEGDVLFDPPLYILRYSFVMEMLHRAKLEFGNLKKVVDLGCSEGKFLKHFRNGRGATEELIGVDIDGDILAKTATHVKPLVANYLNPQDNPFQIELLKGSVADMDKRLYQSDAVCAIELVEHLHPPELDQFPKTVFGSIQPKVAIITTPNREYNVLFNNFDRQFRHPDHKFEWTRHEFKEWVDGILTQYPEYRVEYRGVGYSDLQPNVGPCSQAAVFWRSQDAPYRELPPTTCIEFESIVKFVYPVDTRTREDKIVQEVSYYSRSIAQMMRSEKEVLDLDVCYDSPTSVSVPVQDIIAQSSVNKLCSNADELLSICAENGIKVQGSTVVVEFEDPDIDYDHCELFGTHEYDLQNGVVTDCPCFVEHEDIDGEGDPLLFAHRDNDLDHSSPLQEEDDWSW